MKKLILLAAILFCGMRAHAACTSTSLGNGVTCIQAAVTNGGTSATVGTNFGSNLTANSLVVMAVTTNESAVTLSAISDTCSDTWHASTSSPAQNGGNSQTFLEWTITSGGCSSITMTLSGSVTFTTLGAELSGIATSTPLDCDHASTGSTSPLTNSGCTAQAGAVSASLTGPSIGQYSMLLAAFKTSTGTNDLVITQGGSGSSGVTFTAGSGYTLLTSNGGTGHSAGMEGETVASSGTTNSKIVGPTSTGGNSIFK